MSDTLVRSDVNGVAILQLCRPQAYNSLSMALMESLIDQLDKIDKDDSVRVVLIKGEGRGFCAGHDLKEMVDADDEAFFRLTFETCSKMMQKISGLSIPVIAQVHGVATAAGCQLVASCDLAYAAESARFGTPGVNIGLFCSTPMVAISRTVSQKHAMELLLTAKLITAQRAERIGLINQAVADVDLDDYALEIAELIASKSRKALSIGKSAYHQQLNQSLESAYEHCSDVMTKNVLIEDAQEGIDAFITKRQPVWKHR